MKLRKESVRKKLTGFAAALGMLLQSVGGYPVYASEELPGLQAETTQYREIENETEPADETRSGLDPADDADGDEGESGQAAETDVGADEESVYSDAENRGQTGEDPEKSLETETGLGMESSPAQENDKKTEESADTKCSTDAAGEFDLGSLIYMPDSIWAEGDELASEQEIPSWQPRLYQNRTVRSSNTVEAAALIQTLLACLGAGYSQENRLGPDYYDCSGLVFAAFRTLGISGNVPLTTKGWDDLCSSMNVGDTVVFSGSGGSMTYCLTAKNVSIQDTPGAAAVPGSIMIFIEPGQSSGHAAVSLGCFARQDEGIDPETNGIGIEQATIAKVKEILTARYGVSRALLDGTNRFYGGPNVWMDAFSLGTDVNLGAAGYSGEYQPVFRIDALNTEAGVSVNNLATGKSGTTVRYLLEPVTPAKKGMVSFRKDAVHTKEAAIGGGVYGLYRDAQCTDKVTEFTTAAGTEITLELDEGTYYCREERAPAGFEVNPAIVITISAEASQTVAIVLKEEEWSASVTVKKQDSETGGLLTGAEFALSEWSEKKGEYVPAGMLKETKNGIYQPGEWVCGATNQKITDGMLYYTTDNKGKFRVAETKNPAGYSGNWTKDFILSQKGADFVWTADNTPEEGTIIIYKEGTGRDGKLHPLAGAVFGVFCSKKEAKSASWETRNTAAALLTTGTDGKAVSGKLTAGSYFIKELKAPDGYLLDDTIYENCAVGKGESVTEVTAKPNRPVSGKISLKKVDAETNAALNGAVYTVYRDAACTKEAARIEVVRGAGEANVPWGIYWVRETKAPEGYCLDPTVYGPYQTGGTDKEVVLPVIREEAQHLMISIEKQDAQTGKIPQGEASLAGAVFALKAAADIVHPDGMTGVLYRKGDLVAELVTDAEGRASVDRDSKGNPLYFGTYELTETKAPAGYVRDTELHLEISAVYNPDKAEQKMVYVFAGTVSDDVIRQRVILHKISDAHTEPAEELAGVGFRFYSAKKLCEANGVDSCYELPQKNGVWDLEAMKLEGCETVIGEHGETELFTDRHGKIKTIPLVYGMYLVVESTPADGFQVGTPFLIQVPTILTTDENGQESDLHEIDYLPEEAMEIPVINWPAKAYLQIEKLDAKTGERILQANTEFQILKKDGTPVTQIGWDGVKEYKTDRFLTNGEGWLRTWQPLAAGTYRIRETSAPAGYQKGKDVIVEIRENGGTYQDGEEIYPCARGYTVSGDAVLTVPVKDEPVRTEFSKTDITSGEEISGARLQIWNQDGELVSEWVTDGTPHRVDRLPSGTYTLREIQAPTKQGYVRAEDVSFTVEETGEIRRVEMKDDYTKVEISKTDLTTGEELEGAKLQILNPQGELVAEWVTDGTPYRIDYLEPGDGYTLVEIQAPDGYELAEQVMFSVPETGELIRVEMKDRQDHGEIVPTEPDETESIEPAETEPTVPEMPTEPEAPGTEPSTEAGKTTEPKILGIEDFSGYTGTLLIGSGIFTLLAAAALWMLRRKRG